MRIEDGPIVGHATVSQGGRVVGTVAIRRLVLPPGWTCGQDGEPRPMTEAELRHARLFRTVPGRLYLWTFGCTLGRPRGQCYCSDGRWS